MNNKKPKPIKDKKISIDMLHYKNNRFSFWMIILAIVLNVVMFLIIYKTTECTPNVQLGIDLLINVVFMLACFLAAGKTSKYSRFWGIGSIVLGGIQVARIFWIPLVYYLKYVNEGAGLNPGLFAACIILLVLSAACLVFAGIDTLIKHKILEKHEPLIKSEGAKKDVRT